MIKATDISRMCKVVEACFGSSPKSSRHFEALSDSIHTRTGILLSPTTLKRLWGYLDENVNPRLHTLDTLCRYAGWNGWHDFTENQHNYIESGPIDRPRLDVCRELKPGNTIILTWKPERVCEVKFLGENRFEVISCKGTRLQPGDSFRCTSIIADEPLYLDHLTRSGADLGVYVCGRNTGIRFTVIDSGKGQKWT